MQLENAVVAITGGAQGLGLAMASRLIRQGAHLALLDMNEEALATAVESCGHGNARIKAYRCNVASEEEVVGTFNRIREDFGQLDALVNNAGILRDGLLLKAKEGRVEQKMTVSQWQTVIDVNLTGPFLCGREAAALMIETGRAGCIVNISSISRAGNMGQSNYSAAKAGLAAMTVTWARELARYGIRVMGIAPGFIATEMTAGMKPEALEKMTGQIPLRRMGRPEELAHTLAYILENDYLSGRVIEIDGGLRL